MIRFPIALGISLIALGTALIGKTLKNGPETKDKEHPSGRRRGDNSYQSNSGSPSDSRASGLTPVLDKPKRKRKNARMEPDTLAGDSHNGNSDGSGGQSDTPSLDNPVKALDDGKQKPQVSQETREQAEKPGGQDSERTPEKGISLDARRSGKSAKKTEITE